MEREAEGEVDELVLPPAGRARIVVVRNNTGVHEQTLYMCVFFNLQYLTDLFGVKKKPLTLDA